MPLKTIYNVYMKKISTMLKTIIFLIHYYHNFDIFFKLYFSQINFPNLKRNLIIKNLIYYFRICNLLKSQRVFYTQSIRKFKK